MENLKLCSVCFVIEKSGVVSVLHRCHKGTEFGPRQNLSSAGMRQTFIHAFGGGQILLGTYRRKRENRHLTFCDIFRVSHVSSSYNLS